MPLNRFKPLVRYLRIGWTMLWLMSCMLLIVLWARSYLDPGAIFIKNPSSQNEIYLQTKPQNGNLVIAFLSDPQGLIALRKYKWESGFWSCGLRGFGDIYNFLLYIPFWILVTLTSLLAAIPWTRSRSWRFSLRTLLIFTTLVAVVLGLIVWAVNK